MTKNLYYRAIYGRQNRMKSFFWGLSIKMSSYPKLLLEVFIRRNFGERYFSSGAALGVAFILTFLPVVFYQMPSFSGDSYGEYSRGITSGFLFKYATWYLFLTAFLYFAWQRRKEVKRNPSVFDFGRFTKYAGDIDPWFYKLNPFGKTPSVRAVEILYEPAVFFIAGFILWFLGQRLGILLMVSSVFYSLSYVGLYKQGDDFIMDKIDEMILNQEMEHVFVDEVFPGNSKGVRFYSQRPTTKEMRRKVADEMLEKDHSDGTVFFAE